MIGILLRALFGGGRPRRRSGIATWEKYASPPPASLARAPQWLPPAAGAAPRPVRVPPGPPVQPRPQTLRGRAWVVDGDTIVIEGQNIRLAGIDAPELDHPWGVKAKWALVALCRNRMVTAELTEELTYNRRVGICRLDDGRDLAAEMVRQGLALDWKKYSGGRYLHLETPDARKRLWRADARQKGRMIVDSGR